MPRSVVHKEEVGQLCFDSDTDVSVGKEVPDRVQHLTGDVELLQLVQQSTSPHRIERLLQICKYTVRGVYGTLVAQSDPGNSRDPCWMWPTLRLRAEEVTAYGVSFAYSSIVGMSTGL